MENLVLCTKCGKWVHGRCDKMKRVTWTLAKDFICKRCVEAMTGTVKPAEQLALCDQVELVRRFCYLGDRLNAGGGSEAAVTARARIRRIKFRECGELFNGRFLLKMKGPIYQSCTRSAILYGSTTCSASCKILVRAKPPAQA